MRTYTSKKFAVRKVKNGKVKIGNNFYKPDEKHMKYDGRLEAERFAFGRYSHNKDFVCLWGTGDQFFNGMESIEGPHVVDGTLPWDFWERIK